MAGARNQSFAKLRAQMCTADFGNATNRITVLRIATDRSINLKADFHRPDLTACIAGNLSAELGNPQFTGERKFLGVRQIGGRLFRP
jgi:hypothetical protein